MNYCILLLALFCLDIPALDYIARLDKITNAFTRELAKRMNIIYYGGGGAMMHEIEEVTLSYEAPFSIELDNARILYVACVEELISRIEADKPIRPYFANYPLIANNIDLRLRFSLPKNKAFSKTDIIAVFQWQGTVFFDIKNQNPKALDETILKESYKESKRIVEEQLGHIPTLAELQSRPPFKKNST